MEQSPLSADLLRWIRWEAWRVARWGLPRSLEVEDLVQEGCLGALRGYEQVEERGLAKGARWAIRNLIRQNWYGVHVVSLNEEDIRAPSRDEDLIIDLSDLVIRVLTPLEERIIAGYHLYGYSWAEVARQISRRTSTSSVKLRARRGLDRLHKAVDPTWERARTPRPLGETERFRQEMAERRRVAKLLGH